MSGNALSGYLALPVPGGSDQQVQFNDAGVLAGNAGLLFDKATGKLTATLLAAPGSDTQVLFNDGGNIAANAGMLFVKGTGTLSSTIIDQNAGKLRSPVGTGALTTTEGYLQWQSTRKLLLLYDGVHERSLNEEGFGIRAFGVGVVETSAFTTSLSLPAGGGSVAVPVRVTSSMMLADVELRSNDTATARTWGWDLYEERNAASGTLDRIAASNGNETFTPGAASNRFLNVTGTPIYLAPGTYWIVIQNRHVSNTFAVGSTANASAFATNIAQTKTTSNPNGATLDMVTGWSKISSMVGVCLRGCAFGQSTAF